MRKNLLLMGLGGLAAAAVLGAGPAKADPVSDYVALEWPAVCGALNANPTLYEVDVLAAALRRDTGWSYATLANVVAASVNGYCPSNIPVLQRYAAVYGWAGSGSGSNGGTSGMGEVA